jgi:hypothetical protein
MRKKEVLLTHINEYRLLLLFFHLKNVIVSSLYYASSKKENQFPSVYSLLLCNKPKEREGAYRQTTQTKLVANARTLVATTD